MQQVPGRVDLTSETAGAASRRKRLRLAARANLFIAFILWAPDSPATAPPDGNRFLVAPYVWATNVDAELALGPDSVPVKMNVGDVLSYVKYGAMGYLQWNFNNNFLFADGTAAGMDTDEFEPFFNDPLKVDFRVVETGYGRHFLLRPASGPVREILVSPHVGILHGSLKGEASGTFNMDIDYSWTGMTVGGTVSAALDKRFRLTLRTVHSGFSGGLKDFYNVLLALRYRVSDRVALGVGYRIANARYMTGDTVVDVDLNGALLGVELSW